VYLGQTVDGVSRHSHGAAAVVGYVIVGAFAVTYLVALQIAWGTASRFWPLFGLAVALTVAETFFAADDALVFCVYVSVLTIAARRNVAIPLVIGLVIGTALAPRFVPGWGGQIDWNGGLTVFLVSFAMYGFFMIIRANVELTAARTEVARLAAENERSRIARDLHDLLGHSLTTITVKAGLARRLSGIDQERAAEEIAAVEQLSRRTLVEVRAAVSGYRDVTLAGELATAREVLRAAGIEVSMPGAVDGVDVDAVEPFGWVVREAITNVVRHSRAAHCTITLGSRWIEISDDGRGTAVASPPGNGLAGLRERLAGVDGTITATGTPRGFTVRAELSPIGTSAADQPLSVDA
jgi:two-component system sensor histidine kinase DesK